MNPKNQVSAEQNHSASNKGYRRLTATLLLTQFAAMWGAFFILAPSINWPASLDLPPAEIFPLIQSKSVAVLIGYVSYLVHALLLIPIAAVLPIALNMSDVSARTTMLFGSLAGFAKALGITRWIFLMPVLAAAYLAPETSDVSKQAIGEIYKAFNAYAGGVGEILGVGLFTGVWTALLSIHLWRTGYLKLAMSGMVAAVLLLSTLLSVIGIESPVMLTLSGIFWQLWTFALAVALLRVPSK